MRAKKHHKPLTVANNMEVEALTRAREETDFSENLSREKDYSPKFAGGKDTILQ
jgi:hypothetical protein